MEHPLDIGIQSYKIKKKICIEFSDSELRSVYKCNFAPSPRSKNNLIKQLQTTSSLKPMHQLLSNFT